MGTTFSVYARLSFMAVVAITAHAFLAYNTTDAALQFLCNARAAVAVSFNLALVIFVALVLTCKEYFLGPLRSTEMDHLSHYGGATALEAAMFLMLTSPTLHKAEASVYLLLPSTAFIILLKWAHILGESRLEYSFERGLPETVRVPRLFVYLSLLLTINLTATYISFQNCDPDSSLWLWFLYEYFVSSVQCAASILKLILDYLALQLRQSWNERMAVLLVDTAADAAHMGATLMFLVLFVLRHPSQLPIHMAGTALQVGRRLLMRLIAFRRGIKLQKELLTRFSEASLDDIEAADFCIICRDKLWLGSRKLSCNHIFHEECLRAWFVQQQTCPTCRGELLKEPNLTDTQSVTTQPPRADDNGTPSQASATANEATGAVGNATLPTGAAGATAAAQTTKQQTSTRSRDGAGRSQEGVGQSQDGAGQSQEGVGRSLDGAGQSQNEIGRSRNEARPHILRRLLAHISPALAALDSETENSVHEPPSTDPRRFESGRLLLGNSLSENSVRIIRHGQEHVQDTHFNNRNHDFHQTHSCRGPSQRSVRGANAMFEALFHPPKHFSKCHASPAVHAIPAESSTGVDSRLNSVIKLIELQNAQASLMLELLKQLSSDSLEPPQKL